MTRTDASALDAPTPTLSAGAFDQQVEQHYSSLYQYAYHLTRCRANAEDLTQETFLRAYRSYASYDPSRPFRQWLFRIAHNLFVDGLRGRKRPQTVSIDTMFENSRGESGYTLEIADSQYDPQQLIVEATLDECLETALQALPTEFRQAVILCDLQGLTYEEIAQVMGCSSGTVRSRIHRGRLLLRKALNGKESQERKPRYSLQTVPSAA